MELPDDVGADLAGGGQDPKEIPTRRWSERVSEASRILPKHRARAYQRPGSRRTPDQLLSRLERLLRERRDAFGPAPRAELLHLRSRSVLVSQTSR